MEPVRRVIPAALVLVLAAINWTAAGPYDKNAASAVNAFYALFLILFYFKEFFI